MNDEHAFDSDAAPPDKPILGQAVDLQQVDLVVAKRARNAALLEQLQTLQVPAAGSEHVAVAEPGPGRGGEEALQEIQLAVEVTKRRSRAVGRRRARTRAA